MIGNGGEEMTAREFVSASGLTATREDFTRWVADFREEMARGLAGESSSLRMIPTYLSAEALPRRGEPVIVLDAGGTNLRVALMEFDSDGRPRESWFQTVPMLGTRGKLTAEEFYDALAKLVAPVAERSRHIGFCFSFPCEILPDLDGKVLHLDKELETEGMEGTVLGDGLRAALARLGLPHRHRVVVINDTVAAMLGAMAQRVGGPGAYMGFILGTGTNLCASFPNGHIAKVPALGEKPGSTIVNLESGGFDKLARTEIDLAFDATTANPGSQVLEKLISGAYQGPMILAYLRAAARAGAFTAPGSEAAARLEGLTARDVSQFLQDHRDPGALGELARQPEDREAVLTILDAFFRRAARLTAATLCAVLAATGQAGDPDKPVNIAAEGTTFYRCHSLRAHLLRDMEELGAKELGLYCRFVQGENPNLTGSALAALAEV